MTITIIRVCVKIGLGRTEFFFFPKIKSVDSLNNSSCSVCC